MKRLPDSVDGVAIYTLRAPHSSVVRYVGSTTNPRSRLSCHISSARRGSQPKKVWLRSLLESGKSPVMTILRVVPHENRVEEERREIGLYDRTVIFNDRSACRVGHGSAALPDGKTVGVPMRSEDIAVLDRYREDQEQATLVLPAEGRAALAIFRAGAKALGYEVQS